MEDAKKIERKKRRFAARLLDSKGVQCLDTLSCNIILCNAGQATGLEKNDIYKLIESSRLEIPGPKLIAEKGETYSFLVFDKTEHALLFYNTLNGKAKVDESGSVLYMSFVGKVPNTEFVCQHEAPKGLVLLHDFITEAEEKEFIQVFDWTPVSSNLKNRQVKHYGFEFRYGSNDVDLNSPLIEKIPKECDMLWTRLMERGYTVGVPNQLTVNKYCPGQGIPLHVDKHSPFGGTILSLSLGADVVMDWRHHTGKHVPVLVPSRSLLVMQDEARYDWQHGIQPRTWDPIIQLRTDNSQKAVTVTTSDSVPRRTRISLTFRWTRCGSCECVYRTLCDSVNKPAADDLQDALASNLEELHVHQVYEQIAGHFSATRHKPWPRVLQFMAGVPTGSIVFDLGCGNGKNILDRTDIVQVACERSARLLEECARVPHALCVRTDVLHAALADCAADVLLCVAVVHHFSTQARRLQAISTIHRVLRSGGRALITVWAKDQTRSNYLKHKQQTDAVSETRITVGGVNLPVHENRTQFKHNDLLVPWKLRKVTENKLENKPENTLLRYYHVFEENELDELCREVGFEIENSFYEEGNWCVVCKKK